jgi:aldose sugar dehydrogenase
LLIVDLPVNPGPNHDGGVILFGPDGKLYAVIGDLNRNGQLQNFPSGAAPDDTSVIVRLNDDGSTPATIRSFPKAETWQNTLPMGFAIRSEWTSIR